MDKPNKYDTEYYCKKHNEDMVFDKEMKYRLCWSCYRESNPKVLSPEYDDVACEDCGRTDCIDGTDGRCMNCGATDQI